MARDRDLPIDLAKELERLSRYEHISRHSSPLILRHLRINVRSGTYHILSRLQDSGADYSKRNNHIAHHIAFTQEEAITLPDPATLLLFWKGWKNAWHEPPRVLNQKDAFNIQELDTSSLTSHSEFESAIGEAGPQNRVFLIAEGQEYDLAIHYRVSLLKLPVRKRWDVPFTNFILTSDRPNQFIWSANWKGRSLPFELAASASDSAVDSPAEAAAQPAPEPSVTAAKSAPTPFKKIAPTVEIPEELDRAARRRPKQKWTRKRFSRALNLGLAFVGALCIGMLLYFVYDYKHPASSKSPEAFPTPGERIVDETQESPAATARAEWDALKSETRLYENSEQALELAKQLSLEGDARPLEISQALVAVKEVRHRANDAPAIALLSPELIAFENEQWLLEPTIVTELSSLDFVLLPYAFFIQYAKLNQQSDSAHTLVERLSHDHFSTEEARISLNAINRAAKDALSRNSIESIAFAEEFRALWKSLHEEKRLEGIQRLETAFRIKPLKGFFAVDEDGFLVSPDQTDVTQHILNLYEQFILQRFSSFKPTAEFQLALKEATRPFDTTIEAARALYATFNAATANTPPLQEQLEAIRGQWRETFIRDDLMEETIINFNFERLATSKSELARLQTRFTRQALRDLVALTELQDRLADAEKALSETHAQSQWLLLDRDAYLP